MIRFRDSYQQHLCGQKAKGWSRFNAICFPLLSSVGPLSISLSLFALSVYVKRRARSLWRHVTSRLFWLFRCLLSHIFSFCLSGCTVGVSAPGR